MAASLSELSTYLGEKLIGRVNGADIAYGELTMHVEPRNLIECARHRCVFTAIRPSTTTRADSAA